MNIFLLYSLVLTLMIGIDSESIGWLHCTTLDSDGKYHVCWTTSKSLSGQAEIIFGVDVQAHGYVGFGLSPNGGMTGSDIVTGWVKDGKVYFQNRHGVGNKMPEIVSKASWVLLRGNENDTHTSLVFKRKLDTCDDHNIKIDDSTIRLIYAYSDKDPSSENHLTYHQTRRGTKSVLLLQPHGEMERLDDSQLLQWDVRSPNFTITSEFPKMYWCKIYKGPTLPAKHHIVMVEPLIQKEHLQFVHHLILYECIGGRAEVYEPYIDKFGHQCFHPNMPDAMKKCESITLAWAVGGENLILPEHVGLSFESDTYYMLEIHYDNPQRYHGLIDSSGFRIHYTPKLREYNAGNLMIGAAVTPQSFVPPRTKEFTIAGHSSSACLDPVLPKKGVKILGTLLHAHLLGRSIKARHFRNKTELPHLVVDKNYDFNYQEYRYYSKEVDFLPGDQITLECTYDSTQRSRTTFGGPSTQEEMCVGFFLYYPKIERTGVTSVPKIKEINTVLKTSFDEGYGSIYDLYRTLLNFNWAKVNMTEVENILRYSQQDAYCLFGDGTRRAEISTISYPTDFKPYKEKSTCT